MKINSITKLLSVLTEGESIRGCEIGKRVADKYHDGTLPKAVSDAIRNALPTMSRKGFLKKVRKDGYFHYSLTEKSNLYTTHVQTKNRTDIRQIGCYKGEELICSRSVNFNSQIVSFEAACKEHFGEVEFKYYYERGEIYNVPMPSKNKISTKPKNIQKIALYWLQDKSLGSLETLSKQLNTPLPKTKEQIVEFYNKAISLSIYNYE